MYVDLNNKTLLSLFSRSFFLSPLVELDSFEDQNALVFENFNFG
jgi:hypothetical protein